MIASPAATVMLAAVIALAVGIIHRRRLAGPREDASSVPPTPIVALARVPAPSSLRRRVALPDPSALLEGAGLSPDRYGDCVRRARAGGIVVGAAAGIVATFIALPLAVLVPVFAVTGRFIPDSRVRQRAHARRMAIVRALPDLLDLMVICVEAGMALDPALRLAAERLGGPLGTEIGRTLDAQALGTPRRLAYYGLAARVGSDDVGRLVGALVQAEELGTPLATALAGQAEALRAVRRQLARDRAARAAPRIQLVVALVMVPGALLLVLGMMVVELAAQIGAMTG